MTKIQMKVDNISDMIDLHDKNRIYFIAIDGRTNDVLEFISMNSKYYDVNRQDVINKSCERLAESVFSQKLKK